MTKEIWLNIPVKNVTRSKEFFKSLGFSFNEHPGNTETMAGLMVGSKNVIVMLVEEQQFRQFAGIDIADTGKCSEILISIDAESRVEVDQMAAKAVAAGGSVFGKPSEIQGWMYGCGFSDLDGHRWNVLYMDMSKMPGQNK